MKILRTWNTEPDACETLNNGSISQCYTHVSLHINHPPYILNARIGLLQKFPFAMELYDYVSSVHLSFWYTFTFTLRLHYTNAAVLFPLPLIWNK